MKLHETASRRLCTVLGTPTGCFCNRYLGENIFAMNANQWQSIAICVIQSSLLHRLVWYSYNSYSAKSAKELIGRPSCIKGSCHQMVNTKWMLYELLCLSGSGKKPKILLHETCSLTGHGSGRGSPTGELHFQGRGKQGFGGTETPKDSENRQLVACCICLTELSIMCPDPQNEIPVLLNRLGQTSIEIQLTQRFLSADFCRRGNLWAKSNTSAEFGRSNLESRHRQDWREAEFYLVFNVGIFTMPRS